MASLEDSPEFKRLVSSPRRPRVEDVVKLTEDLGLPKNRVNLWELFDRIQYLWTQKKYR